MSAEVAREDSFRRKKFIDRYQKTNQFVAVALTDGYQLTQEETDALTPRDPNPAPADPSATPPPSRFARQAFRGRIIGNFSPHWFLPDPCDLAETIGPVYTSALIIQHTEFILTQDYYDDSGDTTISRNDRVNVYLEPGDSDTPFNLERGWCVGVSRKAINNQQRGRKAIDCTTLHDIVEGADLSTAGGHGSMRASEVRPIDFHGDFKYTGRCPPLNSGATRVKEYFGSPGWNAYIEKLGSFEAAWDSDTRSLAASGRLASPAGMLGRYQFNVHNAHAYGLITDAAYQSIGGSNYGHNTCAGTEGAARQACEANQDKVHAMYKDSNSWAGASAGISDLETFLASQDLQNATLEEYTSDNLTTLKNLHAVDLDSAQDVAGMLAASHLVGVGAAQSLRTNIDHADGNGTPASHYYTQMGSAMPCSSP